MAAGVPLPPTDNAPRVWRVEAETMENADEFLEGEKSPENGDERDGAVGKKKKMKKRRKRTHFHVSVVCRDDDEGGHRPLRAVPATVAAVVWLACVSHRAPPTHTHTAGFPDSAGRIARPLAPPPTRPPLLPMSIVPSPAAPVFWGDPTALLRPPHATGREEEVARRFPLLRLLRYRAILPWHHDDDSNWPGRRRGGAFDTPLKKRWRGEGRVGRRP